MAANPRLALNRAEARHERVMRYVVARMQDTPYVLKGGTALAFAYDLDRHSTDLDFDATEPAHIRKRIRDGIEDAGFRVSAWIVSKDTEIGQRFKVHYMKHRGTADRLLNVDISHRVIPSETDIEIVRGIRTYRIGALFDQKLSALEGRTAGRDLFDLAFIASRYGSDLSDEQVKRAEVLTREYDLLADEYGPAFDADRVLSKLSTAGDRALMLRIAIEELIDGRRLGRAEQSVSRHPLAHILAAHKIWRESGGEKGCRAQLSDYDFSGRRLCGINLDRVLLIRPNFTDTDLRNATLRDAILKDALFDGTDLTGVDATGVELPGVTLRRTRMGPTTLGIAEALSREHRLSAGAMGAPRRRLRRSGPDRGDVTPHMHLPSR